ncbi:Dihydroneopterin aldolase [Candidatus Erwinia haradaeae]|uniref:7,8-dihydroneopterin aldolase n=1 Tax=Candidatus Erwinia haradaeae TaxID=1922217 RepID=A0A451DJQ6_9GAMM|nr:dihydroneopterin aldolase [Candidatus Erwinia haradaeae]VFP86877.1 Dihydroneopterin aldolase [Candidatus Erwinia haradaeae]
MDIVFINKLSVTTTVGIHDWEQTLPQTLLFDLQIGLDTRKAGISDNLKDCLNYASIAEAVITLVSNGKFLLIERVAEEVATLLLNKFSFLWVRIKVIKPNAVAQAQQVGVVIERGTIMESITCTHCNHIRVDTGA